MSSSNGNKMRIKWHKLPFFWKVVSRFNVFVFVVQDLCPLNQTTFASRRPRSVGGPRATLSAFAPLRLQNYTSRQVHQLSVPIGGIFSSKSHKKSQSLDFQIPRIGIFRKPRKISKIKQMLKNASKKIPQWLQISKSPKNM